VIEEGIMQTIRCPKCGYEFASGAQVKATCRNPEGCRHAFRPQNIHVVPPKRSPTTTVFKPANELPRGNFDKNEFCKKEIDRILDEAENDPVKPKCNLYKEARLKLRGNHEPRQGDDRRRTGTDNCRA
jgi:hypothetical protein